jgi:hypothetical protein
VNETRAVLWDMDGTPIDFRRTALTRLAIESPVLGANRVQYTEGMKSSADALPQRPTYFPPVSVYRLDR